MHFLIPFLLAFLGASVANAEQPIACEASCMLEKVEAYYDQVETVWRKGSTMDDVDHFLSQVHDDVRYVHVIHYADFNKDTWRRAFQRQLELGSYDGTANDHFEIINHIAGADHIAIESVYHTLIDGHMRAGDPHLEIFSFKDGKIVRVEALW